MAFKFNGEVVKAEDGTFSVKLELIGVPSLSEAQQLGKFMHEAICDHLESRGATLLQAPEKQRIILQS